MTRTSQEDGAPARTVLHPLPSACASGWRRRLPRLTAPGLSLRELRTTDSRSLVELLASADVTRFISPPPASREAFERFLAWSEAEQRAGRGACFAVVPRRMHAAIGVIQVRQVDSRFECAEWGIAIGQPFWGTGLFAGAARLLIDFSFDTLGVRRLEARSAVENRRANGALAKLGAVQEAVLPGSFECHGTWHDQAVWSIPRDHWRAAHAFHRRPVH